MAEPIIQPELFPKDVYMYNITVIINLNTSSLSLSLMIVSDFERE